jgi:hypothetical protein
VVFIPEEVNPLGHEAEFTGGFGKNRYNSVTFGKAVFFDNNGFGLADFHQLGYFILFITAEARRKNF